MVKNLAFFLFLVFMASGCGQGPVTKSEFVISTSALTAGMVFPGGGLLKIVNAVTGESFSYDMTTTNVVQLPAGTWDMFFVGFQGSNAWEGPHICGGVSGIVLNQAEQTVNIYASAGNCTSEPYLTMINSKATTGIWDQSLWGQATWGT